MKVIVNGNHVQCYRDGQLEHDIDYDLVGDVTSLYAVTARDNRSGDLILKVVNVSSTALDTEINIGGAANLTGKGTAVVLASENAADENSLDSPTKVSPATAPVAFGGTSWRHSFPANSFTVLRLKAKTPQTTALN